MAAIALALRDIAPSIRVPFVVTGASHSFLETYQLPYFTMPTPDALFGSGSWDSWPVSERKSIANSLAQSITQFLAADVIVFDCIPDLSFVNAAVRRQIPMVLILRKMKDFRMYFQEVQDLLPLVRLVLVPHESGEFEILEGLKKKTVFVGQIVRPGVRQSGPLIHDSRREETRKIVITGGGGGYQGTLDFYNLALGAVSEVRKRMPSISGLLIAGPLFQDWLALDLAEGVRILPFDPDTTSTFSAADLVISQAGYNTMAELGSLGTQTICVPAPRGLDDQFERAVRLSQEYSHIHVFTEPTVVNLAEKIEACLLCGRVSRTAPGVSAGAQLAAEQLRTLLAQVRSERGF